MKGEPAARTVALVALVVAVLALALAVFALVRASRFESEIRRLGDLLEHGARPGLVLEPLSRPAEPDPDPR